MFSLITKVFISIHEYANEKKIHIGPLDERTYQIVSLIILKLATIVVLRCLGLKYVYLCFFLRFNLMFKVIINIHQYAN